MALDGRSVGESCTTISPEVADSRPARMRRSVVLPQPLGPTTVKNSPAGMVSARSSTATTVPFLPGKLLLSPRTVILAGAAGGSAAVGVPSVALTARFAISTLASPSQRSLRHLNARFAISTLASPGDDAAGDLGQEHRHRVADHGDDQQADVHGLDREPVSYTHLRAH